MDRSRWWGLRFSDAGEQAGGVGQLDDLTTNFVYPNRFLARFAAWRTIRRSDNALYAIIESDFERDHRTDDYGGEVSRRVLSIFTGRP